VKGGGGAFFSFLAGWRALAAAVRVAAARDKKTGDRKFRWPKKVSTRLRPSVPKGFYTASREAV